MAFVLLYAESVAPIQDYAWRMIQVLCDILKI